MSLLRTWLRREFLRRVCESERNCGLASDASGTGGDAARATFDTGVSRRTWVVAEITYLIAFRDGTIRAAIAYGADGSTLHYGTRDHQERTVALDEVDRTFSEKLNRDQAGTVVSALA